MSWKLVALIVVVSVFFIGSSLCDECYVKSDAPLNTCDDGILENINLKKGAKDYLLKGHTYYQRLYYSKIQSMEWDPDLEKQAQDWANQCKNTNEQCRTSDKYKRVYQLMHKDDNSVQKRADLNFSEIKIKFLDKLSDPKNESLRSSINYDIIDRIGCGLAITFKDTHFFIKHIIEPKIRYSVFLVCQYAATSENN